MRNKVTNIIERSQWLRVMCSCQRICERAWVNECSPFLSACFVFFKNVREKKTKNQIAECWLELFACVCLICGCLVCVRSFGARIFYTPQSVRLYFYLLLSFLTRLTFFRCCCHRRAFHHAFEMVLWSYDYFIRGEHIVFATEHTSHTNTQFMKIEKIQRNREAYSYLNAKIVIIIMKSYNSLSIKHRL